MTVVSAMRFDSYQGALVCDEQTTFGDNRYAFLSDKIKPLIPEQISREHAIFAAYGGSGTQSVAAEVVKKTQREIIRAFTDTALSGPSRFPFKTMEDVARFAMKKLLEVKHDHLNDKLYANFHFTLDDFNRGFYEADGDRYDIKQEDIIDKATEYITWKDYTEEMDSIFKNKAIVAGFAPDSGFEIYSLSLMENECFFCGGLYETIGSGSDIASITLNDFINTKVLSARRKKIDPLEGIIELIRATNASARRNYGVGGYFNLVMINGRETPGKQYREIMDHKARLASEIVYADEFDMLSAENTQELIGRLIFKEEPFQVIEEDFCRKAKDVKMLNLLLRGYKIEPLFNGWAKPLKERSSTSEKEDENDTNEIEDAREIRREGKVPANPGLEADSDGMKLI